MVMTQVDRRTRLCEGHRAALYRVAFSGRRQNAPVVDPVHVHIENAHIGMLENVLQPRHQTGVATFGHVWDDQQRHRGVTVEEMTEFGYSVAVPEGYDEAVIRARLALKREGFSILTEMHVGGILGPEAGDDRQYLIMAVWNSAVDQRDLDENLRVAVHMPCNVVVQEVEDGAIVAALDPIEALDGTEGITPDLAEAARAALVKVLDHVATPLP